MYGGLHHVATSLRCKVARAASGLVRQMAARAGASQPACTLRNDFLREGDTSQHLSLIVLNNTLPQLTAQLWRKASFRVCADGGANRLFDDLPPMLGGHDAAEVRKQYLPQAICGDLDSLRPDVRAFYEGLGVACHDLSDDQDSTDFEKCLRVTAAAMPRCAPACEDAPAPAPSGGDNTAEHVLVVLGAMGGRMDHVLSHLNVLYAHPDLPIVLVGDGNAVRLLRPGTTTVRVVRGEEGPYCGVVPLAGPATVSSKGLKWDMDRMVLEFGGRLSTSNQFRDEFVTLETSHPCLWITSLQES